MVRRRTHADVAVARRREQTDEVDQAEDAAAQGVLLPLLVDQCLRLLEEQPRAVQIFVLLGVEEVGTDNGAYGLGCDLAVCLVHDAEAGAQARPARPASAWRSTLSQNRRRTGSSG